MIYYFGRRIGTGVKRTDEKSKLDTEDPSVQGGRVYLLGVRGVLREAREDLTRLAVPGESFGLTLILRFSDRCRNPAMLSSATGSGIARFRARQGKVLPLNKVLRPLITLLHHFLSLYARRIDLKARYHSPFRAIAESQSRALPSYFIYI